jgi:hypothetical protein
MQISGRILTFTVLVLIPTVLQLYGSWRTIHQLQQTLCLDPEEFGCGGAIREIATAIDSQAELDVSTKEHTDLYGFAVPTKEESTSSAGAHITSPRQWPTSESVNVNTNRTISRPISGSPPTLFWHVGPHKTSTTAIQSFLAAHKKVLLEKDNIVFPWMLPGHFRGTKNTANLAFCLSGRKGPWEMNCQRVLQSFQHFVARALENLKNIVLSAEEFAFCHEPQIHQFVQDYFAGWEIQVIVFHRRFDEWLSSLHFEMNRDLPFRKRSNLVDFLENPGTLTNVEFHYSHKVRERYQSVTDHDVMIVNFHTAKEGRSLVEQFTCDGLQGMAPHTCRAAQRFVSRKINGAHSLDSGFLLAEALEQNMVPLLDFANRTLSSDAETSLLARIDRKLETSTDLPVRCLSETTQDHVWNRTKEWFPFDLERSKSLSKAENVSRSRTCCLDVSRVCALDDWKAFFRGLPVSRKSEQIQ